MVYTREDFDNINSWFELREFCEEYGIGTSYDYVDLAEIVDDYWVKERVMELAQDCYWSDIASLVSEISNSQWEDGYYQDRGYGMEELSWDYFDDTKAEVLEEFHNEGNYFEDEPEDEDEDVEEPENQHRPSKYARGVSSVYGRIAVQDCYEQPDVVGCSAEDFGKFFGLRR